MSNKALTKDKVKRKDFEAVKRMNINQFEKFCESLYLQGVEAGQASYTETSISKNEIKDMLLSTKGIGEKRAAEVINAIERRMNKHE